MRKPFFALVLVCLVGAAQAHAQQSGTAPAFELDEPSCLTRGEFHRICTGVVTGESLAYVRLFFQASGTEQWYYVNMVSEPGSGEFCSTLPRPSQGTEGVSFYLEASDQDLRVGSTPPRDIDVRDNGCERPSVALSSLSGLISVFHAGTDALVAPLGFEAVGLAAAAPVASGAAAAAPGSAAEAGGQAAGAAAEGSNASAASGGGSGSGGSGAAAGAAAAGGASAAAGLSAAAIGGIAAGAAGAVGLAVAASGGDSSSAMGSTTSTGPVDSDGDGFTLTGGDCNDADPSINPAGALTATFRVQRKMLQCNERQMYTITFDNKSCSAIRVATLELDQINTENGKFEPFQVPFNTTVPAGRVTEVERNSNQYCCLGVCTNRTFPLMWNMRFRTDTNQLIDAGSDNWVYQERTTGCCIVPP